MSVDLRSAFCCFQGQDVADKFGEFSVLLLSFSVGMRKLGVSLYSYIDVLCRLCTVEKDA